jgi:uncharacterized membrane protein
MKRLITFLKSLNWNRLITAFIMLLLALMLVIILSGGFEGHIGTLKISVHRIKNPFRVLLLLVLLKIWIEKKEKKRGIREKVDAFLENKSKITVIVVITFAIFIWIKLSQHFTFRTGAFDLSMYDSALSNTLKGHFMYTPWLGRSYFSEHFAPILLLILPFYLIYDSPVVLVIIQAVAVVLSVFPLYKFAKEKLSDSFVPFCIVIAYLNYRYLLRGFMFDFHQEIFEPLFVFSAFLYLYRNAPVKYFIFLILALACKEDMPFYMAMFGGYACLVEKKWKLGIPTVIISVIWALIAWKIVIPMSFPDGDKPSRFLVRWSQYGQTYTQIAWNLLTHPSNLFGGVFLKNVKKLLSPLGYIPVASPVTFLLSIPPLLLNSTSEFDLQMNLQAHYALPIVPFVFIALIFGLKNLCGQFPRYHQGILTVFCLYTLVMNVTQLNAFTITKHDLTGHKLIKIIPDHVTISTQTSLVPHLRRSHQIHLLPYDLDADYVFFDTQRFTWPMSDETYKTTLQQFLEDEHYERLSSEEGFYLFRKRTKSTPNSSQERNSSFNTKLFILSDLELSIDKTS